MSANRVVTEQTERFFRASDTGDAQVVAELLHDPLVDLNWHCVESYGATPVIAAIANGHLEVVQLLLSAGVQLGALKTPDRNSPLHEAAFRNNAAVLGVVLAKVKETAATPDDATALINLQNQFGNTPLHNAARCGGPECVELLLAAGADVHLKNANGSIPLHHACYSEEPNEQAVQLLLDAGSDVNAQDAQGCTPVIAAAKKNQAGVIALLRARGADLSIKNTFGEDAVYFAQLRDNSQSIQSLT